MTANRKSYSSIALAFVWLILMPSCGFKPSPQFAGGKHIAGLASLIELQEGETQVVLNDYFRSDALAHIDSVSAHISLRAKLSADHSILYLRQRNLYVPQITEVKIWLDGVPYSLMTRRPVKNDHTFTFNPGEKKFREVAVRGDMTGWDDLPMGLVDGVWQLSLPIEPGRYQYVMVTDGRQTIDPLNDKLLTDEAGGFHSLLEVGSIDHSQNPRVFAREYQKGVIELELVNDYEEIFVLWENFRLPQQNMELQDNRLRVTIPGDAYEKKRSFIRVLLSGEQCRGNDLLIPLQHGIPLTNHRSLTRQDREATIMYFLMVDRFFNGNTLRDDPIMDEEVAPRANFHGGDLDGVLQKLKEGYFEELGVNAVWFSPITQNPLEAYVEFPEPRRKYTGYHGYWPVTLTTIDHRFGDDQVLEELVRSAHKRNISVLLDFVSNHVHENNPLFIQNPHWATTLELPNETKNIRRWDEHRLTTWFDEFLPSLDFSLHEVEQTMVDSAYYWMDKFNLDGYRHDATKHVPQGYWRALTRKIKEEKVYGHNNRPFQIGETFGNRELIAGYIGSGMMDGKFDFNLYWDARDVFAGKEVSFEQLDNSLHMSFNYYGFQNLMGNITGNHDMPRFISYAGGDLSFEEDATQAGWEREVGVGHPVGYKRLSALMAFNLTIPGIPVIYYGDEIGLPGANDPDSRRPMLFDDLSSEQELVKGILKKLTRLRRENLALIYGDFNSLLVGDELYVFARSYFGNRVLVAFNKSDVSQKITVELPPWYQLQDYTSNFGAAFNTLQPDILEITLPPHSFEIFTPMETKN